MTMFIILNGPLGIGKSTLADALGERFDVDAPPDVLVQRLLARLRQRPSGGSSQPETPRA